MRIFAALLAIGILGLACASKPPTPTERAQTALAQGDMDGAIQELEQAQSAQPEDIQVALALAELYFIKARAALDQKDDEAWLEYLEKSQGAVLAAVEINPNHPGPHFWMGLIAAYQSDLDRAANSFENALRLQPGPVHHLNLAETYIYQGKLAKARRSLAKARRLGAHPVRIELNEMLAAWRRGDYVEARDLFDVAYGLDPDVVRVWNEAPVTEPIESFEDFTAFCCSHIACGPYMADACREMELEVNQRTVAAETARQELVLEMERRRKLREIYDRHGSLTVVVEEAEEPPPEASE